jgi:hypothetical protein
MMVFHPSMLQVRGRVEQPGVAGVFKVGSCPPYEDAISCPTRPTFSYFYSSFLFLFSLFSYSLSYSLFILLSEYSYMPKRSRAHRLVAVLYGVHSAMPSTCVRGYTTATARPHLPTNRARLVQWFRMSASHRAFLGRQYLGIADDPGSNPGSRTLFCFFAISARCCCQHLQFSLTCFVVGDSGLALLLAKVMWLELPVEVHEPQFQPPARQDDGEAIKHKRNK